MLRGIGAKLKADVLCALQSMRHGDTLIAGGQSLPTESLVAAEAVRALLSVLPLDTFVDAFARQMAVVGNPDEIPQVQVKVQTSKHRFYGSVMSQKGVNLPETWPPQGLG